MEKTQADYVREFKEAQMRAILASPQLESSWPTIIVFKSGLYEHITDKPVYIRSRKELRRVCTENGCTSDYAE